MPKMLDNATVQNIVRDRKSGMSAAKVAEKYGVSRPTVYRAMENDNAMGKGGSKLDAIRNVIAMGLSDETTLVAIREMLK